jgi:SAM-dependent methyltransferase
MGYIACMFREKRTPNIQSASSSAYSGIQELLDAEEGLLGYSTEIVQKLFKRMNLKTHLLAKTGSILEFGAGTGSLADLFRTHFDIKPDCVELDPNLVALIKKKHFTCYQFLNESPQNYAAIYTSNVLEHIEDDSAILKELFNSLRPGGVIGIYVPANPFLYSGLDKEVGHVRRYTKLELRMKVSEAGFLVQSITYDEFIGFFAALVVKIFGYKNAANLGSKKSLIFYDRCIYPISKVMDAMGFRYLLGKNLLLIAKKLD